MLRLLRIVLPDTNDVMNVVEVLSWRYPGGGYVLTRRRWLRAASAMLPKLRASFLDAMLGLFRELRYERMYKTCAAF
jgi:hypothetical protein